MRLLLLLFALFALSSQHSIWKRANQNGYGDENSVPGGDDGGYQPVTEETVPPVDNGYDNEAPPVYKAGYRRKRDHNSYGDENVTPGGGDDEGYQPAGEETVPPVDHGYDTEAPPVYKSGYRKKRDHNSYGDENVTPGGGDDGGYQPAGEETVPPVDHGYDTEAPPVYKSGYRRKRDHNSYGDENVTPGGGDDGGYNPAGEETVPPVDHGYDTEAPPVEKSGYRRKRDHNSYGDENVTPGGGDDGGYQPAGEETVPPVDHGYDTEAPPVYKSGYRKKRDNKYGDENVTPGGGDGGYNPVEEETVPPIDHGYDTEAPPVEKSGYRRKRDHNSYGDENVTPGGGDDGGYNPAGEETVPPVDHGYDTEAPPVYKSGY